MYKFSESNIKGMGTFATEDISVGSRVSLYYSFLGYSSVIYAVGRRYQRTDFCRFTNHSASPNVELVEDVDGNFNAYCIKPIRNNEEILINYSSSAAKMRSRVEPFGEIISEVLRCTPGYENMIIPPDNTNMGADLFEEAYNLARRDRHAKFFAEIADE